MNYKQAILVRQDLKLPKGKLASQVAHASFGSAMNTQKEIVKAWEADGMGKVVLRVKDEVELKEHVSKAEKLGIATSIIKDAGLTVVKSDTVTCAGIGPDKTEKVDKIVSGLKLV